MKIDPKEARQALSDIESAGRRINQVLVDGFGGLVLIWWGFVVTLAYLLTYTFIIAERYAVLNWLWPVLMLIGWGGMMLMNRRYPIKSKADARAGVFWLILFVYAVIWLYLLRPWSGEQMNLFIITLVMFAYVVIGLWAWVPMFWIGIGVTVMALLGYGWLQSNPLLWIWMAGVIAAGFFGPGGYLVWRAKRLHA